MSQKTNPISLRLQNNNKHFESCWYSDFFYGEVLSDEIRLRTYIEGLLLQVGCSKTLPSIQSQYKRYCTFLFFLDQRAERHKREFSLKLSREPAERVILPRTKFLQSKRKAFNFRWETLVCHDNRAHDVLCKEKVLEERDKNVIEEITKQHKSSFTHNGKQEYVYKYAIKGFFLQLLFLAGLDSRKLCSKELSDAAYNCIVNPGLKQNPPQQLLSKAGTPASLGFRQAVSTKRPSVLKNNPKAGGFSRSASCSAEQSTSTQSTKTNFKAFSYTESKNLFSVSLILFALVKVISYTQKPVFEKPALIPCSALHNNTTETLEQSKALLKSSLNSNLYTTNKIQNILFYKNRIIKEPFSTKPRLDNILSVRKVHENLFRSLVVAEHSQSTQNRLSFWFVRGLKKRVRALHLRACSACSAQENKPRKQSIAALVNDKPLKEYTTFESVNLVNNTELKRNGFLVSQKWESKSLKLAHHTELLLNTYSDNFLYHTIYPVRAISPYQSASFLLESIAYLLRRKSSFRKIKDDIFRELGQYQLIKGARLSCAGRLGGRSKKAQKAKVQTAQWGETSLTVFCSRLAFASKGVKTTYGKVGVKLWLCYK